MTLDWYLVGKVLDAGLTALMVVFVACIAWLAWRHSVPLPGWPPRLLVWLPLLIAAMDFARAALFAVPVHYVMGAAWAGCALVTWAARRRTRRLLRERMLRLAADDMYRETLREWRPR